MAIRLDPVDVLVVGSGMGGAAFCARLAERAPKLRIACLERGGWVDRQVMPPLRRDWQRATLNDWAASPNMRLKSARPSPSADYAIDDTGSPIKPLMWSGVGGSASIGRRISRGSIRRISYTHTRRRRRRLAVRLLRSRALLRSQRRGDGRLRSGRRSRLSAEAGTDNAAAGSRTAGPYSGVSIDKLGWHWWPVDAAINTVASGGRGACNYCGPCQQGCVISAKASTDVTYWPKAIAAGVELRAELHRPAHRHRGRPGDRRNLSRCRRARDAAARRSCRRRRQRNRHGAAAAGV